MSFLDSSTNNIGSFAKIKILKLKWHITSFGIYIESPLRLVSGPTAQSEKDRIFILNGDSVKRD